MPADEHTIWPHGVGGALRVPPGATSGDYSIVLAAYLTACAPPPHRQVTARDANLSTHNRVRSGHRTDDSVIHHVTGYFVDETHMPPVTVGFITACGHVVPFGHGVRCGLPISCTTPECAWMAQKHERPGTIATSSGPCHGGAAKKTSGVTLPDNSVAIRPDEDSFRSVKSADANPRNGQPRSQVATASATARTTSSARAGRPSKGEHRVMESVAPDG